MSHIKINRGSEWRVWDLHIHTPSSINQQYGDNDEGWDKFINALANLPKEVKVIGITDYYFIDGYEKVMQAKLDGKLNNLDKIFPILEFRINTFGSGNKDGIQKINLHILFDVDENELKKEIQKIKDKFISLIKVSPTHKTNILSRESFIEIGGNLQDGFSSLIPDTEEVFEIIDHSDWKEKTFLFLGYSEWSNLEKNQQVRPLKEKLYNRVNAFFNSNSDGIEKGQKWLDELEEKIGKKRLLHSLDIHNFNSLDTYEFDENGVKKDAEKYHCHTWIKADPTFNGLKQIYNEPIERVEIQPSIPQSKAGYQVIDHITINHKHFKNQTLYLNENLNSIIGGRSTGKSVLLGAIAKKLDNNNVVKSGNEKYESFVYEIVEGLNIVWKDGKIDDSRDIEYFPQSHMYTLTKDSSKLDQLVDGIIRQDGVKNQLVANYKSYVSETNTEITNRINRLFQLIEDMNKGNSLLKEKGDEIGIIDEIKKITDEINTLKSQTKINEEELKQYNELKVRYEGLKKSNENLSNELLKINAIKEKAFVRSDIEFDLVSISEANRDSIVKVHDELKVKYQIEWVKRIETITELNDKIYVATSKEILDIESNAIFLKGIETFKYDKHFQELENRLKIQTNKLADISQIKLKNKEVENQIIALKDSIKFLNKSYLEKIQDFQEQLTEEKDKLKIKAKARVNYTGYKNLLYRSINQQSSENQAIVNKNIKTTEELFESCHELFEKLIHEPITLKGGNTPQPLCQELMSTNFFDIAYEIVYEEDNFNQMSEGKKAFVVLMLLLDFNKKDCPILIDQPEDDLDNRAIYTELVKYLISKKRERQIILVTHNPNIVVGADSELVIVANQQGLDTPNENNIKFQYTSGSLENSQEKDGNIKIILDSQGIKQHVCEILEGGNDAFKQRELKYALK